MVYCPYGAARAKGHAIMSTVAASPDGLRWSIVSEDTSFRHQHEQKMIWDESIQRWIAYSQYSHHWHHGPRTRQIGRQTSPDFIHWSPKEVVLSVDWEPDLEPHLEFHEMSIRKVGGLYIGIVTEASTEPLWCVRNGTIWKDQFHASLSLYVSRDGIRFSRAGGSGPWVDHGPPGSIDYGKPCFTTQGFTHNGRMIIPYLANPYKQTWFEAPPPADIVPKADFERNRTRWDEREQIAGHPRKRRSVGALIMREDGWAELKPTYESGIAYTKQFVFEGDMLKINAACEYGFVKVALLNEYREPYEGFSAAECDPVHGPAEQIWHTVSWAGRTDTSALWNKPVVIAFHLCESSLFAFQFVYGE